MYLLVISLINFHPQICTEHFLDYILFVYYFPPVSLCFSVSFFLSHLQPITSCSLHCKYCNLNLLQFKFIKYSLAMQCCFIWKGLRVVLADLFLRSFCQTMQSLVRKIYSKITLKAPVPPSAKNTGKETRGTGNPRKNWDPPYHSIEKNTEKSSEKLRLVIRTRMKYRCKYKFSFDTFWKHFVLTLN